MLRSLLSIIMLFLITSCATAPETYRKGVIPESKIISRPLDVTAKGEEDRYNIALLAPMSKQKEHIGSSIIKAAQLALSESYNPNVNLVFLNSDLITEDPDMLLTSLKEHQIKLIVGPVYTKETEKLVSLLAGKDITILSLSNDSSIKDNSLLMMGISPEQQAIALTNYEIGQGINHFHLLAPSTKYGKLINNELANIVSTKNNVNYQVSWYSTETAANIIESLVKSIASSNSHENQAIFMPQAGVNLATLNNALERHKLKIQLIGSSAWDNQNTLKFSILNGAVLIKKDMQEQKFFEEYEKNFGAKANNIDSIAYNSVAIIVNMHKKNLPLDKSSIIENNPNLFSPQGTSLYNLQIISINNGEFKNINQ